MFIIFKLSLNVCTTFRASLNYFTIYKILAIFLAKVVGGVDEVTTDGFCKTGDMGVVV